MARKNKEMPVSDAVDIYIAQAQTPIQRWQIEEWSFGRIVYTIIKLHEELLKARKTQRTIALPANHEELEHLRRINAELQAQNDSLWADLQECTNQKD